MHADADDAASLRAVAEASRVVITTVGPYILPGRQHRQCPRTEETGGYRMFTLGGALVAGLGPKMSDEQVTAWATYMRV